jgi:outer membrane receptor for ferrienterochelin and colicins
MKYFSLLMTSWAFTGAVVLAQPRTGTITGKVIDQYGVPTHGASVSLKSSGLGESTQQNGAFTIKAPAGKYLLQISVLGCHRAEQFISVVSGQTTDLGEISMKESVTSLNDVVVTGQFEAQSLKQSVYQVRTIDSERIRLRGATNVQTILNTELGMRFSNDLTLGTSDIQLMGMSGQSVKILLDGVPMVDRGGTRESIGQIDINTVERIEIVEGPMSVIYGTDALAGVINIITKKGSDGNNFTVSARLQEETAAREYNAFTKHGTHNQNMGLTWQQKGFQVAGNLSRNNFGGWQGSSTGRAKAWMPKDQMLYTASLRYRNEKWNLWYRFNGTDESIHLLGNVNGVNSAGDKDYDTYRWFHQLQTELRTSDKLSFVGALSYTDYSRKTLSTNIDFNTGKRTLALDAGTQDKSIFTTTFFRGTALYKLSPKVFVLGGIDYSNNNSSGQRILGSPTINEYALFLAPELKVTPGFKLSPGMRFLKNSVYDAPPIVPSLNGKLALSRTVDLRFGYARGFRSPALRELYFHFYDASHSISGNVNLKAEYSNSFNMFVVWQAVNKQTVRVNSTFGTFHNIFHDRIDIGVDPNNTAQNTYLNVSLYKTTGFTLDNKFFWKNLQASIGASYIGQYNDFSGDSATSLPELLWSPEINSNILYTFSTIGASINFSYKYTGTKQTYQAIVGTNGAVTPRQI